MANERTDWAVEVPHLGALILTHTWDGAIKGLKEFPPQDRPNSPVVFWAFRIMVGLGLVMAAIGVWAAWLRLRGRLYTSCWLRRAVLAMAPSGFIAAAAGWTVTEVGRQPFTVYGLLRTADSVSPVGLPGVACRWPPSSLFMRSCSARAWCSCSAWCAGRRRWARRDPRPVCQSAAPASRRPPRCWIRHDADRDMGRSDRLRPLAVLLDGFDLGVGILFSVERRDEDRDVMLTPSHRCGTATRPGWCSAAAGCSRCFRSPMR